MAADVDQVRHGLERGAVIRTLKEDFTADMTSLRTLQRTLDLQGFPLSQRDLEFHLRYLEGQGYVRVWRARDVAGYRGDRAGSEKPGTMLFARLEPKGLQLLDGHAPEDPMVAF